MTFAENIRLVIWDLDETLWQGTLEEGDVVVPDATAQIVISLARRGIVSSLCSKNDINAVKARLERGDLWKWFVFPTFAFAPKSNLIGPMIEQVGLRPQTVLFIDDNNLNRAEVSDRVPGINVASPEVIDALLDHPQLQGKDDASLSRLNQYKVLEHKQSILAKSDRPDEFLRGCEIVISFHTDIDPQFPRIHELVNRTNQLNFTKERWAEDVDAAREEYFGALSKVHTRHACYIKVRDKFGYYGICGFYEVIQPNRAIHFLFSCRVLNMGVEQFIYQKLRFPWIKIVNPCAGRLEKKNLVDWITVVEDAEPTDRRVPPRSDAKICVRGPCELMQSVHYLRPYFETLEEFQFPKSGWGIYRSLIRYLILADELADHDIDSMEQLGLPADFGGFDFGAPPSSFVSGNADVGIFSFAMDTEVSCYRHRATGLVVPFGIELYNRSDLTSLPFGVVHAQKPNLSPAHFDAFCREFEFNGSFDWQLFRTDLAKFRAKVLRIGKPVIVVEPFDDLGKRNHVKYRSNASVNETVRESLSPLGPLVRFVRFSECVENADKQVEVNHFQRQVYVRLAEILRRSIDDTLKEAGSPYHEPENLPDSTTVRLA